MVIYLKIHVGTHNDIGLRKYVVILSGTITFRDTYFLNAVTQQKAAHKTTASIISYTVPRAGRHLNLHEIVEEVKTVEAKLITCQVILRNRSGIPENHVTFSKSRGMV